MTSQLFDISTYFKGLVFFDLQIFWLFSAYLVAMKTMCQS